MSETTIEDAKLVQKLAEHLKKVREVREYLKVHKKTVQAAGINLEATVSEQYVPSEARAHLLKNRFGDFYHDGKNYRRSDGRFLMPLSIHSGPFDPTHYTNGRLTTLGLRVMDGVRAAVEDEIEMTEAAIVKLGFKVP